ncbi:MFS transporter [Neobacillus notoginsengisoli]|uniref:MFS transporter n=1 Tax=Neobacillus notoginsengisoli TaxID=1578198 RepID=A0A417YUP4_9BACI|nr:MFS transporter [Neobacillus notoginsengisoli]RHW41000.1 MFS transporter [Neobacillus notoginsengisoli]
MAKQEQISSHDSKKLIPYWVKVVIVFFFGWIALYATRTILNPIMNEIQVEFGLSASQLGLISSLFFLGYAGLNVPSGILGDKFGKKRVLVPGFILFGIFAAITGMMPTFFLFISSWLMVGIFQGFYYGPQYGLSTEAIPRNRITVGSAFINSGMAFGTSLGYYISTYTVDVYGMNWRTPFFIMAVFVVLVGLAIIWVIKDRPKTLSERTAEQAGEKFEFSSLFKNWNLIMNYITIFTSIYGFFVIITWLPYYLEHARGVTGGSIAFVSSLVPWASIPAAIFFSWIADKMGKRRPVLLIMMPMTVLCVIAIVAFDSMAVLYAALIGYGIFGKLSTNPILLAVTADNAPKGSLGTAFGLYNFIGMCGSILAPYITGYLTDLTGSLNSGFYFAAGLLVIGTIASFLLKEDNKPKVDPATV